MSFRIQPLVVAAMLVVVAVMLYDLSTEPRCQLTYANFAKLEKGMTFAEAVAILGEPTGLDESLQDQRWATWRNPFDVDSMVTAVFTMSSDELKNMRVNGTLLDRPRRFPEVRARRPIPTYVKQEMAMGQDQERRKTLMTAPPKKTVDPLFLP
jgi:hypothetical protein